MISRSIKILCAVIVVNATIFGSVIAADPPLRDELTYANHPGGMVQYVVKINIGQGRDAETYKGNLDYSIHSPGRWSVTGDLNIEKHASHGQSLFNTSTIYNTNTILDTFVGANTRIEIDRLGNLQSSTRESQMKLLLGDFTTLAIVPLPAKGQTTWKTSEPVMVQRTERDKRFGGMMRSPLLSTFDKKQLAAAIETTTCKITGTEDAITVIEHTYKLDASKMDPPIQLTGKGTGRFDRKRGVFDQLDWTREVVMVEAGAEVRIPVSISIRRDYDFGLIPLTEEQKAAIKAKAESPEAIAAAKAAKERMDKAMADSRRRSEERKQQREAEAAAPFDESERKAWIAALTAGTEYGDGAWIYSKLNSRSPREDLELAQALIGFANRLTGSLGIMFFDQAAKFDPKFAEVLKLRKAYANSHTNLTDVGPALSASTQLTKGQLVAVQERYGQGHRAKLVIGQAGPGIALVASIGSSRSEEFPVTKLHAPSEKVVTYLPAKQKLGVTATNAIGPAVETATTAIRTWTDRTGNFTVQGRFVSFQNDIVRLEKGDGKLIDIGINHLSEADAKAAREFAESEKNPFKPVTK